jgi:hypothetical protein
MGEDKANTYNRRLIVRLRVPSMDKMVVEVELGREYLGRCWKLMLICGKIRRTMHGRARVVIEDAHCQFVSIMSEAPIQRLLSIATMSLDSGQTSTRQPRPVPRDGRNAQESDDCGGR